MEMNPEPDKHIVFTKCSECYYHDKTFWFSRKRKDKHYCHHPDIIGVMEIKLRGKRFPKECPLQDYQSEHCNTIQLRKKKMNDYIKQQRKTKKMVKVR